MAKVSTFFIAGCLALLIVGTAAADIGSFSFSSTVLQVGDDQIDATLTSSTYGASTPYNYEALLNYMTLYNLDLYFWTGAYSYDYRFNITLLPGGPPHSMRLTTNWSFSGLPPGNYAYWVMGAAYTYTTPYTTRYFYQYTADYDYGYAFLGVNIPTAGQFGLMLLGLALAASGVILLRRA